MSPRRLARAAEAVLWAPVVAYALLVSRSFFHHADRAVHLATDDGVANIAYALATEGRYGFLSSPVLVDMARDQGLFSYGPYYFYLAAALVWLFGYSLTIVRAVHLGAILAIAAAGRAWFGRTAGGAAAALLAVGLIVAFERGQWPMARPDSMVSLCAVALVVAAGVAIRSGRAGWWAVAGLAGACGAFTHLVAWSLVPAVAATLALALLAEARDEGGRWRRPPALWRPVASAVAGGLAGALLFYASFGFRFRDQIAFLADYQRYTGSLAGLAGPGSTFGTLVLRHFKAAYWYLPYPLEYAVWATLIAGAGAIVVVLLGCDPARRRARLALVGPPVVVWGLYLLSLGAYNNFHGGYAILNQVMWLWTGAALVAAGLEASAAWPVWGRAARAAAWAGALALGVGVLTLLAQRTDYRALAAASSASIAEYTARLLEPLPARARAWGTVEFGIEHPGRVQLVQFWDGIKIVERLAARDRAPLAPDYLVWAGVENRLSAHAVLVEPDQAREPLADRVPEDGPRRLLAAFPERRYTLVSITAAPPYGVARVYAWAEGAPVVDRPMVNVYDAGRRQWNRLLGAPAPLTVSDAGPAHLVIGPEAAPAIRTATQTLGGALAEGVYLLRVAVAADLDPSSALVVVASPALEIRDDVTQAGSALDVSPWFAGEPAVHLVYRHPGGPFYVSQFGTAPAALQGVEAAPILALDDYARWRRAEPPEQPLPASGWEASFPEIRLTPAGPDRVAVRGNTVQYGYQVYGPRIPVAPGQRMRLRVPIEVARGTACLGVLDGTEMRWLVLPDRLDPVYEFVINDSRTVRPVLANCSGTPDGIVPIEATIGSGDYAVWSDAEPLYVDQLMDAFRKAAPR